ncbi:MAG TPA: hypothetical protein VGB20_03685 [bacterium]
MFERRFSQMKRLPPAAPEVSEARFRRFLKDLESYERHSVFDSTMDGFLDLYSHWRRTHDEPTKLRLVMLAFELHRLDREFECDLCFEDVP